MSPRPDDAYPGRRRLVIVQADSGDRLSVVEDPSGMYWKALHLPGSYALISWWESGDWHEAEPTSLDQVREYVSRWQDTPTPPDLVAAYTSALLALAEVAEMLGIPRG